MDPNRGSLALEAIVLPTVPQPLPKDLLIFVKTSLQDWSRFVEVANWYNW